MIFGVTVAFKSFLILEVWLIAEAIVLVAVLVGISAEEIPAVLSGCATSVSHALVACK